MMHKLADSRRLANLLSQEKEYSRQLGAVLETSQASLASFSAYSLAHAPPISQAILSVAGALAGADGALHKYLGAVDGWRDQLRKLKELESEVWNIVRDREILVTRLIRVSRRTRGAPISRSGSSSSPIFLDGSSRLNAAESELQACEAHLASREKELEALRLSAIRVGLHARCTAMVNCGRAWGEMGKEGLRALETLDASSMASAHFSPASHSPELPPASEPLPDPADAPSDLSSTYPSHSASQVALAPPPKQSDLKPPDAGHPIPKPSRLPHPFSISLAHHTIPTGAGLPPRPSAQDDSSSDDHRTFEVVENDPLLGSRQELERRTKSKRHLELSAIMMMSERPVLPNGSLLTKEDSSDEDSVRYLGVPARPLVDEPPATKTPPKSALGNHSRTPSPYSSESRPIVSSPPPVQPISKISETPEDDPASISSYETVDENLDSRSNSPPAPPLPPKDPVVDKGVDSSLSRGTSSTATGSVDDDVSRRGRVRMQLPLTYLKTLPTKDHRGTGEPPSSLPRSSVRVTEGTSRRASRNARNLWGDSSDEQGEFATARRLRSPINSKRRASRYARNLWGDSSDEQGEHAARRLLSPINSKTPPRTPRLKGPWDPWEDSSEEDEEYSTARRLLRKLSGRR